MTTPKKKVACLHHNDADGQGSAFALWKALGETCELSFIPVQYGQEPPYEALRAFGPDQVYVVDFSYKAEVLTHFLDEFPNTFTIDHHATSYEDLWKAYSGREAGWWHHDTTKSGCILTWEYFFDDEEPPDILRYVQDRDLWKFDLENSREINAYIATMPKEFTEWDDFYLPEAYTAGKAVMAFQAKQVERRLKDVKLIGYNPLSMGFEDCPYDGIPAIPIVNASENISELGEAMCLAYPESPFSISYCDRPDGKRSYSLRSRNGFDAGELAREWGGGGHKSASGFTLNAPEVFNK